MPRLLSRKERLILDIVSSQGDPHALEVIRHYHRRSGEPLEPTNVIRALQDLVHEGLLRVERRPAPEGVPFEEMVHFTAGNQPADESAEPTQRNDPPLDTAQLLEIIQFALRESVELKLARRVSERSESA